MAALSQQPKVNIAQDGGQAVGIFNQYEVFSPLHLEAVIVSLTRRRYGAFEDQTGFGRVQCGPEGLVLTRDHPHRAGSGQEDGYACCRADGMPAQGGEGIRMRRATQG